MEDCFQNLKPPKVAICACSGGVDSMVLAFLMQKYLNNTTLHIVIVNHNLREGSTKESNDVANYLKNQGFVVKILYWHHEKIKTKVEEEARNARQKLIFEYAIANNIQDIFFAHHADDVVENFFIKLEMKAGIFGLSSLQKNKIFRWNGHYFNIVRPLIHKYKKDISTFARENNIFFVEDETNFTQDYKRGRIRLNMQEALKLLELTKQSIINSVNNLNAESRIISLHLEKIFSEVVKFNEDFGFFVAEKSILELQNLELKLIIKEIIFYFTEKCEVRTKEIERAILNLKNNQKFTLGGMIVFNFKEKFFFIKEPSKIKDEILFNVWDKRFQLKEEKLITVPNTLPKIILKTLPKLELFKYYKPIPFKILYD